ncbi:MAG: hypothetical protein HYR96_12335 [Deltaproteobacteria bacterium]|nr:hypothetical protein [Deltaproteobacteria bacterium]MBI3296014.1 hypothetical protein [Deltaproteobacteria bacterium]
MRHLHYLIAAFFFLGTMDAWAGLPTGLSQSDINRLVEMLGPTATTRLMRSAEPYEMFPGMRFGVEVSFIPTGQIDNLGDRNGTLAGMNPTPRVSFTKGIVSGFEFELNYFPDSVMNVVSAMGGALKWRLMDEREGFLSGALFAAYTSLIGFEKVFTGRNFELGGVVSKDYVRLRPFAGAGFIFSSGEVASNFAQRASERNGSFYTIHTYIGCEVLLPMTLVFQIDMMNLSPMFSILIGMTI